METFTLTPGQKDGLCKCLSAIEAGIESLRQEIPQLQGYTTEKVITFLTEVRDLTKLDTALKDDFQPCSNAYEEALDAVGAKATIQLKDMGGVSSNTSKFNMKKGKRVSQYVYEMIRKSGRKKAYFAVHNRHLGKICVVPAANFADTETTYINWSQLTRSPKARLIAA